MNGREAAGLGFGFVAIMIAIALCVIAFRGDPRQRSGRSRG